MKIPDDGLFVLQMHAFIKLERSVHLSLRIVMYILTSFYLDLISSLQADLYAGAIFIEQSMHWDLYWSILLLLSIATIFTITGTVLYFFIKKLFKWLIPTTCIINYDDRIYMNMHAVAIII